MVKSYWLRLFLFSVIGGALALGVSLLIPKKYEGIVQILIDQKAILPNVPTTGVDQSVTDLVDFARSRGIITQVQQLTSIGVLLRARNMTWTERGYTGEPSGEFDYIELGENISVEAEVGSDLVSLRVRMSDPEDAQAMARNIYLSFEEFNSDTTRTLAGQAIQSLESQMQGIEAKLADIDEQTRNLRVKLGAPNIDVQVQADISGLAKLDDTRDTTAIDLAAVEGRLRVLKQNIQDVPKEIVASQSDTYNQNLYSIDQTLASLRSDLAAMEERLLPENEMVVAQKKKIAELEAEREKHLSRIDANKVTTPNPLYQSLESQIAEAEATRFAYQERLRKAEFEINSAQSDLDKRPEAQKQLVNLARQQVSLERTYATYADRLQTLQLAGQGRSAPTKMAGLNYNPDPVSPKPVINMLIGMVLGLVLGVMSMLRTESSRQPVRSIMQLNLLSREPVFRALPHMASPYRGLDASPPEAFEALTARALRAETRPYRVGIVGVVRDSGASTAALNYAISASRRGLNTVLVSVDPRSPNGKRLNAKGEGVSQIHEHLAFLPFPAGQLTVGSSGRSALHESIAALEQDVTVFDFEASTDSADYAFAASNLNEMIVLVRANRVNSVDFLAVQQALRDSGCETITVVLSGGTESDAVADAPAPEDLRALPS